MNNRTKALLSYILYESLSVGLDPCLFVLFYINSTHSETQMHTEMYNNNKYFSNWKSMIFCSLFVMLGRQKHIHLHTSIHMCAYSQAKTYIFAFKNLLGLSVYDSLYVKWVYVYDNVRVVLYIWICNLLVLYFIAFLLAGKSLCYYKPINQNSSVFKSLILLLSISTVQI